jgi:putative hydrolase of the HAD superfamily
VTLRAVLFDYGGTLVVGRKSWDEVMPVAVHSAYRTMKRFGLALPYDQYLQLNERAFQKSKALELETNRDVPDLVTYRRIIGNLFPSRTSTWKNRIALAAADSFWATAKKNFILRHGTKPALRELKAMKMRMAVLSNHHHPKALMEHLKELGIATYFLKVYASAKVGLRKPDPRFFAMCLASIKVPPQDAAYVGDSIEYDLKGASSAGMRTIIISESSPSDLWGSTRDAPDFVVHDLLEVPRIISSLS